MFEKLVVKECCNYNRGNCLGAMFNFSGEKGDNYRTLIQWIDKEKEGKKCLVTQGKRCDFFISYVLPALGNENKSLVLKYEKLIEKSNADIDRKYNLTCKKCKTKFETNIPQKKYCKACQKEIRKQNIKKAVKKHKNSLRVNTSELVTH